MATVQALQIFIQRREQYPNSYYKMSDYLYR